MFKMSYLPVGMSQHYSNTTRIKTFIGAQLVAGILQSQHYSNTTRIKTLLIEPRAHINMSQHYSNTTRIKTTSKKYYQHGKEHVTTLFQYNKD